MRRQLRNIFTQLLQDRQLRETHATTFMLERTPVPSFTLSISQYSDAADEDDEDGNQDDECVTLHHLPW